MSECKVKYDLGFRYQVYPQLNRHFQHNCAQTIHKAFYATKWFQEHQTYQVAKDVCNKTLQPSSFATTLQCNLFYMVENWKAMFTMDGNVAQWMQHLQESYRILAPVNVYCKPMDVYSIFVK